MAFDNSIPSIITIEGAADVASTMLPATSSPAINPAPITPAVCRKSRRVAMGSPSETQRGIVHERGEPRITTDGRLTESSLTPCWPFLVNGHSEESTCTKKRCSERPAPVIYSSANNRQKWPPRRTTRGRKRPERVLSSETSLGKSYASFRCAVSEGRVRYFNSNRPIAESRLAFRLELLRRFPRFRHQSRRCSRLSSPDSDVMGQASLGRFGYRES